MARWLLLLTCIFPALAVAQSTVDGLRSIRPQDHRYIAEHDPADESGGKVEIDVRFKLCIDATGRIACLEPLPDQNPALVNAMLDRIPSWRFKAASRDGLPASAESTLHVSMEGRRLADGKFEMEIADTRIGPRLVKALAPTYPERALKFERAGGVMVTVVVMPDGSLDNFAVDEEVSDRVFIGATLKALRHWKFVPEVVDGVPVASKLRIPIVFSLAGRPPPSLRWEQRRPGIEDQLVTLDSAITLLERSEK